MRTKIATSSFTRIVNNRPPYQNPAYPKEYTFTYIRRQLDQDNIVKSDHIRPTNYRCRLRTVRPGDYRSSTRESITTGSFIDPIRYVPSVSSATSIDGFRFTTTNSTFNTALSKAYADLRENKLSLGLELSQVRQTASFISSTIRDTATVLTAIKTGRFTREAKRLITRFDVQKKKRSFDPSGTFSNRWLEYQFAVKPLMGLVSDSIDRLTERTKWDELFVYAKGLHKQKLSDKRETASYTTQVTTWEQTCRYHLYCKVSNPALFTLNSVGMGYRDIAAIIWDVIPYSFVLDWFVPVSAWLNAYAVQQGLTVNNELSYWTQRVKGVYHTTYDSAVPYAKAKCNGTFMYMERRKIGTFQLPHLRFKPDFFNAFTVIASATLLNQSLRR